MRVSGGVADVRGGRGCDEKLVQSGEVSATSEVCAKLSMEGAKAWRHVKRCLEPCM